MQFNATLEVGDNVVMGIFVEEDSFSSNIGTTTVTKKVLDKLPH